MTVKALAEALKRVEAWPEAAQEELAGIALELDAALKDDAYLPTVEELAGIDRGLRAADQKRFVAPDDVAKAFAKYRPA
jgi:hypothetical protein